MVLLAKGIIAAFPVLVIVYVYSSVKRLRENFHEEWAGFVSEMGGQVLDPSQTGIDALKTEKEDKGSHVGIAQFVTEGVPWVFQYELRYMKKFGKNIEDPNQDGRSHVLRGRFYWSWSTLKGPKAELLFNSSANTTGLFNAMGGLFSSKNGNDSKKQEDPFRWAPKAPPAIETAWSDPAFRTAVENVYKKAAGLKGCNSVSITHEGITVSVLFKRYGIRKPSLNTTMKFLKKNTVFQDIQRLAPVIPRI
jgi:hypothetical protein